MTEKVVEGPAPSAASLIWIDERLDAVARELNGRPRQTLGWMKPSEALAKVVASVT